MTAITDAAPSASDAPAGTAIRERGRLRSRLGWLALVAVAIVLALFIGSLTIDTPGTRGALDPESAKPSGSLAIAELLRHEGIEVDVVRSRTEAAAAVDESTTLVTADPYNLSDESVLRLIERSHRTVFISAASRVLRLLELGENASGAAERSSAQCALPELAHIGTIRPERLFDASSAVTGCFTDASGASALLVDIDDGIRTTMIEASSLFSNEHLAEDGNAALAIALLGQTDRVVWYVPSFTDSDIEAQGADTLADLTPGWVTPVIVLLLLAGIVVAIARGQRFGPLVAETLPVTVRTSETMHGRARLTARAADSGHAAAALRDGAVRRLASRLGLGARATAEQVADAASDRLRIPRGALHQLLAGDLPANDAELVETARRLAELEAAVSTAVHVERNTP